jgi:catechol 2,3-dioxygenase-like lactoylglutathione lyase family enzyme
MGGPTPRAGSVRADLAFVRTPDSPRITFAVDAVDDVLGRLRPHGAELVGEVAQYENIYRYCYIRGPEDILGLVQDLR